MPSPSLDPLVLLTAILITACDQPEDSQVITVPADETYSVVFQEDSAVTVTVYCNACYASYKTGSGGSISIELLRCTQKYCGESQVQDYFPQALPGATFWSIQASNLSILYSFNGETGTLEFEPDVLDEKNGHYSLMGTRWLLKSIQVD